MRFFNRVTLQTPESVELDFALAGIGNRVYAMLIDYLIWSLILVVALFAWAFFAWQLVDAWQSLIGTNRDLELWLIAVQFLLWFVIYIGYFIFFEVFWQGQTPGKRFVKIRVISDDGRPIKLQQATLRALLRPVDELFFCVGVLFIAFSQQEKRLGDWVAGTIVVQEEKPDNNSNFSLSEDAKNLADQLKQEGDLSALSPENFAVTRKYLQRRATLTTVAKAKLSNQLSQQIKQIISWEEKPGKEINDNLFLEAIYLAYQQQIHDSNI